MTRISFVHDWLNGMRGGEKCLETLLELFPKAPVYTLLCEPEKISQKIKDSKITTSWIQKLPYWKSKYRYYLPLFPWAIESLKMDQCDILLSISHCAAKAVSVPKGSLHICYCLTPMRYLWGFFQEYFDQGPYHWIRFLGLNMIIKWMRDWDKKTSEKVDYFIAISKHVAERIKSIYNRDAIVIYPPVDVEKFYYTEKDKKEDYYLIVSALVPYKKIDLAIQTFNRLGYPLKIVGAGTEMDKLKRMSKSNIEFLGWLPDEAIRNAYAGAQALIFPGEEDFGITPVEAQACGTPVIAYRRGGVLETVEESKTGVFFDRQSLISLAEAVEKSKLISYDRSSLRENALKFSKEVFIERFKTFFEKEGVRF